MYNKILPVDEKHALINLKASFAPKNLAKFENRETEAKQDQRKMLILVLDKSGSMGNDFEKLRKQAIDLGKKIEDSNFTDFYCLAYSTACETYKYEPGNFEGYETFCRGLRCDGLTYFEEAFDVIYDILKGKDAGESEN
jgi:uncharacterized protein with von Willebrand factor type A (vWA) domain